MSGITSHNPEDRLSSKGFSGWMTEHEKEIFRSADALQAPKCHRAIAACVPLCISPWTRPCYKPFLEFPGGSVG